MKPDEAVERYFDYLSNPESLVDHDRADALRAQIEAEGSLMEKAKLISELERVQSADPSDVIRGFVSQGRKWAAANGVSASALREIGVPSNVIAEAGIDGRRSKSEPNARAGRGRGVGAAQVKEFVLNTEGPFTYQQLMNDTGSSLMTVRKAVEGLLGEQKVRLVGQDAEWSGPGRAPNLYALS